MDFFKKKFIWNNQVFKVQIVHPIMFASFKSHCMNLNKLLESRMRDSQVFLPGLGFQASHADPSLFVKHSARGIVVLLLYVDDVILTSSD